MNIVQTKKHIDKLFSTFFHSFSLYMAEIVNPLYKEIYDEAIALGFDGEIRDLDKGWIEDFFDEYNPTTKYVFTNELERKKSRLFEAVVASVSEKHKSYDTVEKQLIKQVKQYCIELEDAVAKQVYEDLEVKKVKWVAEKDHKTCSECKELDEQIFDLDKIPSKHWNCRCHLIPVKE